MGYIGSINILQCLRVIKLLEIQNIACAAQFNSRE